MNKSWRWLHACKSEIHLLSHENNPKNDEDLGAHTSDGAADGEDFLVVELWNLL